MKDKVRPGDSWTLMFSASRASPKARDMVWQFTKEKWEVLKVRYQGQFLLSRIIDVRIVCCHRYKRSCDCTYFAVDYHFRVCD